MEQNNAVIKLFYKQAQKSQQPKQGLQPKQGQQFQQGQQAQQFEQAQKPLPEPVQFDIEIDTHKKALEEKIKILFPQEEVVEEVEEVEVVEEVEEEVVGENGEKLTQDSLFTFLSQKIQAEVGVEQKPYHEFLNKLLVIAENQEFAVEFLATNLETTIALMAINNKVEKNDIGNTLKIIQNQGKKDIKDNQKPQNNAITNLIKDKLQDFLNKFFTVEATDERKDLLQKILEIEDINVTATALPAEQVDKKRFIETFLEIFNENEATVTENAGKIIKTNLNDFTEELLKIEAFTEKHIALFANPTNPVITKIDNAINAEEEDKAQAKTNATKIALESKNSAFLEKALGTACINAKIEITKDTVLSPVVAQKLSELAVAPNQQQANANQQQANSDQKTNAKALITKGITAENQTIIKNLTAKAIENLEPDQIKALGTQKNVIILNSNKDIASDLNTSDNPKVKSLAKKIAYLEPTKYTEILKDDFDLSKQLNKTLTGAKTDSVITKDDLKKIKAPTPLLTHDNRTALARTEITEDNKVKMSSIKLGLVNATQKSANNNDTKKLETTLRTASSLIGTTKDNNKVIKAQDITDSAVDFNRDRLKLLGFRRKVEDNKYAGYEVDNKGEKTIEEFERLAKEKKFYKEDNTLDGNDKQNQLKNKWKVKLAFIEFMGYRTPEELSLLKKENNKEEYTETAKIEKITKEIQNKFGWTLETGYTGKKEMKLTYKEPNKKDKVFTDFVQQSINFLKIAEEAEEAEKAKKQPEKTLKGSLGVKKAKLEKLPLAK